jgi:Caspase domain
MPEPVILPDRGRSRAVLVGSGRFEHLPALPAVHNNLRDLRAALTDPHNGIFSPDNCEIVDDPKSPHSFMTRLQWAADRTDDLLLVYYAGHGLRHDRRETLCLTLPPSDPDALDGSSVPFEWVKDLLEHSHARTNLLLLDCCYSGMALGVMSGGLDRQDLEVRGTAVIASSPRNSVSHAPVGDRYTAFTGKMITLLREGSPIPGEPLTVGTLYRRLSVALLKDEFPRPLLKITDTSGDLLVRKPTSPPRPRSLVTPPQQPPPPPRRMPESGPVMVEPPTRPAIQPLRPPATSAQRVTSAETPLRSTSGFSVQLRWRSLQALYGLNAFCLAFVLGSLVGVLIGEEPDSGSNYGPGAALGGALFMAAACGVPLVLLRRRWTDLRELRPQPLLTRSTVGRVVLVCCIVLLIALSVSAIVSDAWWSPVSAAVSGTLVLVEGIAFCGYLVYRWWRPREARR